MTSMDSTPNLLPLCLENPKNFGVKDPGSASIYVFFCGRGSQLWWFPKFGPDVHLKSVDTKWYKGHIGEAWFFLRHFFLDWYRKVVCGFRLESDIVLTCFDLQSSLGSRIPIDWLYNMFGMGWQKHKTWMVTGCVSLQLFGINEKTHEGPWRPVTNFIKGWCSMKQGPTIKFTCSGYR